MARIKHTKNELKAQRDALKRFERYLPTLQLKKQQLQLEVRQVEARVEETRAREREVKDQLDEWVRLLSDPVDLSELTPADVVAFVSSLATRWAPSSMVLR